MRSIPYTVLLIPAVAYLLGSIPFGLILARVFGRGDVRKEGSGNIGATNVSRVAGPLAGILTLLLDGAKGTAAVLVAGRYSNESAMWMVIAGLAALVGHCFPVWLRFKGGKGVATAAGVYLAMSPPAFLGGLILFSLIAGYSRYVSLGSVAAAVAMPLLIYFLWAPHHAPPLVITLGSLAIAILIVYKHDANLQRLVQGTEPKFSFRRKNAE
jgi:acyl phosphate:glycerol-3-phosphate acyltransferase